MTTPETNPSSELQALTASLRRQLEARPTLFDAFSSPASAKANPTEAKWPKESNSVFDAEPSDDKTLNVSVTFGYITLWLLAALMIFLMATETSPASTASFVSLTLLIMATGYAFDAIRALRKKSQSLESELQIIRQQLSALRDSTSKPDRAASESATR